MLRAFTLLFVLPLMMLAQQPAATPDTATGAISGRVTNSVTGEPVSGASVTLLQLRFQNGARQHPEAQSQDDGSFHIDGVAAGTYVVRATRDGYVPSQINSRSTILRLSAGQSITDANVLLNPAATITGKVVDDNGAPVAGAEVQAIQLTSHRGHSVAEERGDEEADAKGVFTLKKLAPGTYFVIADPPDEQKPTGEGTLVRTMYPRSLDFESATPIQVSAGQPIDDITISLRRTLTHKVRGKVSDIPGNSYRVRLTWSPQSAVDSPALTETIELNKARSFEIDDVTPGAYTLRLMAGHPQHLLARQNVDVGASDVDNVIVTPQPPVVLTGKATLPDSFPGALPRIRLIARPLENTSRASASVTEVQPDGTIQTTPLDPGPYLLQAVVTPATLYVKSILFNQQDVTAKAVDVSEAGGTVEIILGTGAAGISGATGDNASGTTVVLAPVPIAPDGSNVQFTMTGPSGAFQFQNVRPGDYKLFATGVLDYSAWQNPDFLACLDSQATTVSVSENQQAQQVEVPVVPEELAEEAAARLGLTLH